MAKLVHHTLSERFGVEVLLASDTAIFISSVSGNMWPGTLPADGEYTVRVYLMRNAARRHAKATYTLTVGITSGPADVAAPHDTRVAETPYHATGKVPYSRAPDPKGSGQYVFGVWRRRQGCRGAGADELPGVYARCLPQQSARELYGAKFGLSMREGVTMSRKRVWAGTIGYLLGLLMSVWFPSVAVAHTAKSELAPGAFTQGSLYQLESTWTTATKQ